MTVRLFRILLSFNCIFTSPWTLHGLPSECPGVGLCDYLPNPRSLPASIVATWLERETGLRLCYVPISVYHADDIAADFWSRQILWLKTGSQYTGSLNYWDSSNTKGTFNWATAVGCSSRGRAPAVLVALTEEFRAAEINIDTWSAAILKTLKHQAFNGPN